MQLLSSVFILFYVNICWSLPISQNINSLSLTELNQYRDCVRNGLEAGSYVEIAGEHGAPQGLCPHGNLQFLPWHRHHLAQWENIMNCTIPYWDWAQDPIPLAFTEETYTDSEGRIWANPLKIGVRFHTSHRNRSLAGEFPTTDLRLGQNLALSRSDLPAFSSALEDAHNLLHVCIGGDMSDIDYASYDPLFYSHHKNVDRVWFLWQTSPSRNATWISPLINDYVRTAVGLISSEQIANDISAWIPSSTISNTSVPPLIQLPNTSSSSSLPNGSVSGQPVSTSSNMSLTSPGSSLTMSNISINQPGQSLTSPSDKTIGALSAASPGSPMMSNTFNNQQEQALSTASSSVISIGGTLATSPGSSPITSNTIIGSQASQALPTTSSPARTFGSVPATSSSLSSNSAMGLIPMNTATTNAFGFGTSWNKNQMSSEPRRQHVLMNIPDLRSTSDGYILNVMFKGEVIGRIGLLGIGRSSVMSMMSYKKDRLLDVTCHLESVDLQQVYAKIRFELFDDQHKMVAQPRLNYTLSYEYF